MSAGVCDLCPGAGVPGPADAGLVAGIRGGAPRAGLSPCDAARTPGAEEAAAPPAAVLTPSLLLTPPPPPPPRRG